MSRPKANNGQRKKPPVSGKPPAPVGAHGDAPASRAMSVRSRRDRFQRAGLAFTNTTPTIVREDEVGTSNFDRILAEPQLRCDMQE